jgi:hypothetical protein
LPAIRAVAYAAGFEAGALASRALEAYTRAPATATALASAKYAAEIGRAHV